MKVDLRLSQSLDVPFLFETSSDCDRDFPRLLSALELSGQQHNVLLLTGCSNATVAMGDAYARRLAMAGIQVCSRTGVTDSSMAEVRRVDSLCGQERIDLIVALGGGKVIDVAKAVVARRQAALVVIPSALSSDCLASPVAVLTDASGHKTSYPSGVASCVFVDLSVVTHSSERFTLSGLGDILSNASALLDVKEHEAQTGRAVNGFAKVLADAAVRGVVHIRRRNCLEQESAKHIASGLVMSGLAMAFAGNSLPCSGGEHLISHALDQMQHGEGTHGLQVALATLYCDALRRTLGKEGIAAEVIEAIRGLEVVDRPEALGISRSQFMAAVDRAPEMRRGRITVLHHDLPLRVREAAYDLAFPA